MLLLSLCLLIGIKSEGGPFSCFPLNLAATAKTLRQNHQSGREQKVQEADWEEGRARAREAWSGEHEEEQIACHQVSST